MKTKLLFTIFIITILACNKKEESNEPAKESISKIEALIQKLENCTDDHVIVVAHRGDWRNAPENSLQSIQNCIDMGVDMVEIDVRKTKDDKLVLMHDNTINRTTNGTGNVIDFTLDSLKTFFLLDKDGNITNHKIPTLEEALMVSKDKILVNLDKSYAKIKECYDVASKTNTQKQIVFKGSKSLNEVEADLGDYLDSIYFMPIVNLSNGNAKTIIQDYMDNSAPVAIEFIIPTANIEVCDYFKDIRDSGSSVWVNSLWASLNGGRDDERAYQDTSVYSWYIDNHIDIIQTDRPQLLIDFLKNRGLHN